MRVGFHVSIAGSFAKVVDRAKERRCETVQIFSRNPRGWRFKELARGEIETFQRELMSSGISPLVVHLPYLPNLAANDSALYQKSVESLQDDLKRAGTLGAAFLVMHPGRKGESRTDNAYERVIQGINQAIHSVNNEVILLVENTAGQGSEICHRFSDLARIVKQFKGKDRLGICLDTAHAFAAGYDLSHRRGVDEAIEEFDTVVGLERLRILHLNDSRTPFNSRVDRHENIGKGFIGLKGIESILHHPLLSHLPVIMETPWKGLKSDLQNMRVVRKLLREKEVKERK